jgi:hypothetical protein
MNFVIIENNSEAYTLKGNISSFCKETQSDYIKFQFNSQLDTTSKDFPEDMYSWQLSLVPSEKYKRAALSLGLERMQSYGYAINDKKIIEESLRHLEINKNSVGNKDMHIKEWYKNPKNMDNRSEIQKGLASKIVLCSKYSIIKSKSCANALDRIVELMNPAHHINLIEITENIYRDSRYRQGLILAASKILKKVKNTDLTGNLFGDLIASYIDAGIDEHKARELSWHVLGVISTNGPNTAMFLKRFYRNVDNTFLVAIQVLSTAPQLLDHLKIKQGQKSYSYPSNIVTTCDYSKPYHFWMAAFLTYKVGTELNDSEASLYATWLAHQGYQMLSTTDGRSQIRAFMVDPFGISNNKIRLDLVHASAGAVFGSLSYQNKTQNIKYIDEAIKIILDQSIEVPVIKNESDAYDLWRDYNGVQGFLRWRKIFAPDSSLNYFMKH